MTELAGSVRHFERMAALAAELAAKDIAIYEHSLRPLAFGSFELQVGTQERRWRFSWEGRDGDLAIASASVSEEGELDRAIALTERLIALRPDSIMGHANISRFYMLKGDKETAEDWISTGDLLNRMKLGLGLAANKIPGVRVDPPTWILDTGSTPELVERLADGMLELDLSPETLDALVAQVENPSTLASAGETLPVLPSTKTVRMRLALGWLLASPEFQRQ